MNFDLHLIYSKEQTKNWLRFFSLIFFESTSETSFRKKTLLFFSSFVLIRRKFYLFTLIFYSFVAAFICIDFLQRRFWNDVFLSLTFIKENHQRIPHHKSYLNFLKILFSLQFLYSFLIWKKIFHKIISDEHFLVEWSVLFRFSYSKVKQTRRFGFNSIFSKSSLIVFSSLGNIFSIWTSSFPFLIVLLDIRFKFFSKIIKISSQNFWICPFWLWFCVTYDEKSFVNFRLLKNSFKNCISLRLFFGCRSIYKQKNKMQK